MAVTYSEDNDAYCTGCLCELDEGKKFGCEEQSMWSTMHVYCAFSA